jgi:5-methylcytosine-specific restriction enzyme subunit McrC
MNLLFEEFIAEFLKKNKKDFYLENVVLQSSKKYVFKDKKFLLKPDIIVEFQDKKIIIDTKYKKLNKDEQNN